MSTNKRNELIACFGLVITTIIWGLAFVVVKNSMEYVPVMYLLAFRFTIGAVVVALAFSTRLKKINKQSIIYGLVVGLFVYLAYVFQTYGIKYTTAGKNAFLTTVYIVLVPFLNYLLYKVKPVLKDIVAAIIAFVGIGLISLTESFVIQLGDWLTIVCGLFFALQIVYLSKHTKEVDPVVLAILQLAFAALFSWITAPFTGEPLNASMFNKDAMLGVMYLGVLSTGAAFLLQTVCQKYAPAGPVTIIMSLESVFGALSGFLFLGEIMTGRMIVGCFLMMIAVIMVEFDFKVIFAKKKE